MKLDVKTALMLLAFAAYMMFISILLIVTPVYSGEGEAHTYPSEVRDAAACVLNPYWGTVDCPEPTPVIEEEIYIPYDEPLVEDSGFRSYLPYYMINPYSLQGAIVKMATPNEHGILCYDGRPLVAIGTGWGWYLGDILRIYTEAGYYEAVYADIKSDLHTDVSKKVTKSNGCVVEFIVDPSLMDTFIKDSGTISNISEYAGFVTGIEKIGTLEVIEG